MASYIDIVYKDYLKRFLTNTRGLKDEYAAIGT